MAEDLVEERPSFPLASIDEVEDAPEETKEDEGEKPELDDEETTDTPPAEEKEEKEEKEDDLAPAAEKKEGEEEEEGEAKPEQGEISEEERFREFSEAIGIEVKNEEDLVAKLHRLDKFEKGELAPVFKSENHKRAYDLLMQAAEGNEISEAKRVISILAEDYKSMSPKEVLKRAFFEEYKGIYNDEEAGFLFEEDYAERYKLDPDEYTPEVIRLNELRQRKDVLEARNKLSNLQDSYKVAKTEAVQDQSAQNAAQVESKKAYQAEVDNAFSSFGDLEVSLSDNPEETFTFQFDNTQNIKDYAFDTGKFLSRYMTPQDKVDWDKFKYEMAILENLDAFTKSVFDHGRTVSKIQSDKKFKNTSQPDKVGAPTSTKVDPKRAMFDEWASL